VCVGVGVFVCVLRVGGCVEAECLCCVVWCGVSG